MNVGFVVTCPECKGLSAENNKTHFRRQLGRDARVEEAYRIFTQLQDVAWETAESVHFGRVGKVIKHEKYFCVFWTRGTVTVRALSYPRVVNSFSVFRLVAERDGAEVCSSTYPCVETDERGAHQDS